MTKKHFKKMPAQARADWSGFITRSICRAIDDIGERGAKKMRAAVRRKYEKGLRV